MSCFVFGRESAEVAVENVVFFSFKEYFKLKCVVDSAKACFAIGRNREVLVVGDVS